jgi:hypothetical protein
LVQDKIFNKTTTTNGTGNYYGKKKAFNMVTHKDFQGYARYSELRFTDCLKKGQI